MCLHSEHSSPSGDDDESSRDGFDTKQPRKRMRLRLPKRDVRRYYSNMFLNVINSANFDYILPYFSNFMNPNARFVLEYVAPKFPRMRNMNMVSEGPQSTAYYLMGLGVMFPDMSIQATSGQVVTSNAWAGCKIVLETTFNYTKVYDISFERALAALSLTYQPYKHRAILEEAHVERKLGQTDCEAARLTLNTHSTSSMSIPTDLDTASDASIADSVSLRPSDAMEVPPSSPPAPHVVLNNKVHWMFQQQALLDEPVHISARCRFVLLLDEHNHINQITVSAVQDQAGPVKRSMLYDNAM